MSNLPVALITQVASLSSHDGPGIRTTVFFKGCSLKCCWCHNPETICSFPEFEWLQRNCIACSRCESVCPMDGIDFSRKFPFPISQTSCVHCFKCVDVCPTHALHRVGRYYSEEDLLARILKDERLIHSMHGGVTFSGGEPALQAEFIEPIAMKLKERKIHLALDTCGKAPRDAYDRLLPWMDLLLFDIKVMDTELHKQFTGLGNETILQNLQYIAAQIRTKKLPVRLWIRTPLIPEMTATRSNVSQIGEFINTHLADVVDKWELCAFNALCTDKYKQQGKDWAFEDVPLLSTEEMSDLLKEAKRTACSIAAVTASGLTKKITI